MVYSVFSLLINHILVWEFFPVLTVEPYFLGNT